MTAPTVGIDLGPPMFSIAVDGAIGPETDSMAPQVGGGSAGLVIGPTATDAWSCTDVVQRLGDRLFLPVRDTYYPAGALLTPLLAALQDSAEQMSRGSGRSAAIAHPADWDARRVRELAAAARAVGFAGVELMPAPEAAAWAPIAGPEPEAGLLLVFDLSAAGSVALLDVGGEGFRLIRQAHVPPYGQPVDIAREVVAAAGRSLEQVREARAVGAGAADPQHQAAITQELGVPLRIPHVPERAIAIGALYRNRRPQQPAVQNPDPLTDELPIPTPPTPARRRRWVWWAAAAIVAVLAAAALLIPGVAPPLPLEKVLPHPSSVEAVTVALRGGQPVVISGANDTRIRVWDPVSGTTLGEPWVPPDNVRALATVESSGTPEVVAAGLDPDVRVWNLDSGEPIRDLPTGHERTISAVAVTERDGRAVVVSGGEDEDVRIYPLGGVGPAERLAGHTDPVKALAIGMRDGRRVIVSGSYQEIRVWDLETGGPVGSPITGPVGYVYALAVGELDGVPVVVSGDGDAQDSKIRVWNLVTKEPIGEPLVGHTNGVKAVAVTRLPSRAQPVIVSGAGDGTVRAWDLATHQELGAPFTGHQGSVLDVTTITVNNDVLAVSAGADGTVRTWNLAARAGG